MAKSQKRALGDIGEGVACKYLEKQGYSLLERNYWRPWGEIDIVAERKGKLSFVEVKSVTRETHGGKLSHETWVRPEENMHPAKLKRLHRAVQTYLLDHKVPEAREWQIDLVCVYLDFGTHRARVELFENIIL